jgi:hypothetical protein
MVLVVSVHSFLPHGYPILKDIHRVGAYFTYLSYSYRSREREIRKGREGYRRLSYTVA